MKSLSMIMALIFGISVSIAQEKTIPGDTTIQTPTTQDSLDQLIVKGSKLIWTDQKTGIKTKVPIEIIFWEGDIGSKLNIMRGPTNLKQEEIFYTSVLPPELGSPTGESTWHLTIGAQARLHSLKWAELSF